MKSKWFEHKNGWNMMELGPIEMGLKAIDLIGRGLNGTTFDTDNSNCRDSFDHYREDELRHAISL